MAAIGELLRLSWTEDRPVLERGALVSRRRLGPRAKTMPVQLDETCRVFAEPATSALTVQRGESLVTLTDLGTPSERIDAAERLRAALAHAVEQLPSTGWLGRLVARLLGRS